MSSLNSLIDLFGGLGRGAQSGRIQSDLLMRELGQRTAQGSARRQLQAFSLQQRILQAERERRSRESLVSQRNLLDSLGQAANLMGASDRLNRELTSRGEIATADRLNALEVARIRGGTSENVALIGAGSAAAGDETALTVAGLRGDTSRDVANIGAAAQTEAVTARQGGAAGRQETQIGADVAASELARVFDAGEAALDRTATGDIAHQNAQVRAGELRLRKRQADAENIRQNRLVTSKLKIDALGRRVTEKELQGPDVAAKAFADRLLSDQETLQELKGPDQAGEFIDAETIAATRKQMMESALVAYKASYFDLQASGELADARKLFTAVYGVNPDEVLRERTTLGLRRPLKETKPKHRSRRDRSLFPGLSITP